MATPSCFILITFILILTQLYIDTIKQQLMLEDTSRPFISSSPSNGLETEKEGWVSKNPQSELYGDGR